MLIHWRIPLGIISVVTILTGYSDITLALPDSNLSELLSQSCQISKTKHDRQLNTALTDTNAFIKLNPRYAPAWVRRIEA